MHRINTSSRWISDDFVAWTKFNSMTRRYCILGAGWTALACARSLQLTAGVSPHFYTHHVRWIDDKCLGSRVRRDRATE